MPNSGNIHAVILYGPPASGKDTITHELCRRSGRYRLFPRVKCGPGRTAGYRMVPCDRLTDVRAIPGEVLWEDRRYDAVYIIDRGHLAAMIGAGLVPVLHLGHTGAIHAVTSAFPNTAMLIVALTCPRDEAQKRIENRATGDTDVRLAAYDATPSLNNADLTIDTSKLTPDEAAAMINAAVVTAVKDASINPT